jgi:predicted DNA-binding transcriptional regulator AlpA
MPELQSSGANESDQHSSILAGYLTPRQMATELGISQRTLERWHQFRHGPPRVILGRTRFYRLESVRAWLVECEQSEPRNFRPRIAKRAKLDSVRHPAAAELPLPIAASGRRPE